MDPQRYCLDKLGGARAGAYYAALFAPRGERLTLLALAAFGRELRETLDDCSDPGVARARLEWWRAEIGRTGGGAPQHPVTHALAPALAAGRLPRAGLLDAIAAAAAAIGTGPPDEPATAGLAAALSLAASHLPGAPDAAVRAYALDLGAALELTRAVAELGADLRRGHCRLPPAGLARFGLAAPTLAAPANDAALRALLAHETDRAGERYARALAVLPAGTARARLPGLIEGELARALRAELRRAGFPVLRERLLLTPARMLWIAWRTHRRAARGRLPSYTRDR